VRRFRPLSHVSKLLYGIIQKKHLQKRIRLAQGTGLLDKEHGPISDVFDALMEYSEKDPVSRYCHFDFGSDNILATEPLTVIDPSPMLNNGIIDIGRSIQLASTSIDAHKGIEQLKEGYFSENRPYSQRALQASIILSAYMKFPYWHKKNNTENIEHTRQYLAETRQNLKK
jgi:hypothetical protein